MVERAPSTRRRSRRRRTRSTPSFEGVLAKDREAIGQARPARQDAAPRARRGARTRGKDAWKHARRGGPGEHGARPEARPGARGPRRAQAPRARRLRPRPARARAKLDLTDTQKDQIKEIMKSEMAARHGARGSEATAPAPARRARPAPPRRVRRHAEGEGAARGLRARRLRREDDAEGPAGHGGRGMAQGFVHLAARITPITHPRAAREGRHRGSAPAQREGFGHAPRPPPRPRTLRARRRG